ncbi:hypothetical protein HDU99_005122 [Rhizoclosmatium hyalinum]|nr:hypothetical protein HDU99_005122 [Rhizoclosmatium hyalinum]
MLAADEWDGVNQVWDNSHRNLMWSLRWYLSPQRAIKVIQILLADDFDPAVQNHRLLVWASRAGWTNVVDLLLSICDSESAMPLNVAFRNAARFGHLAIIERLLLDPRTNAAHENNAAFIYAARYGRVNVIKILLTIPDVDPAAQSSLALQLAARRGHFDVVDILLNIPGVDPCANDEYAFAAACRYSHINIVSLLLKDGRIDPTFGDYLGHAYINGQFELAETLLQDPRVELTGAVLIKAARHADSSIVKLLLKTVDPTECGVMALQYTKTVENLSCLLEDPRIILSIDDKEFLLSCPQWSDRPEFQQLLQKQI